VVLKRDEAVKELFSGSDNIGHARVHRAARHPVKMGRLRVLHHDDTPGFLDGFDAQHAVCSHAGENDADAVLVLVPGQRAEEEINGQPLATRRYGGQQVEHTVQD